MKHHYPLTDFEKHIVRETPEMGWDPETVAEARGQDRLPIDLPTVEDQETGPFDQTTLIDMACGAAVVLLIIAALCVLLWWWSL